MQNLRENTNISGYRLYQFNPLLIFPGSRNWNQKPKWKVLMSAEKCYYTIITLDPAENNAKKKLKLLIGENEIPYCKNPVFLGIKLDPQLTFREHAKDVARKMATRRKALQAIANKNTGATQRNLRTAYKATTRAVADYASSTWMNMAQPSTRDFMESQQNKCACLRLSPSY